MALAPNTCHIFPCNLAVFWMIYEFMIFMLSCVVFLKMYLCFILFILFLLHSYLIQLILYYNHIYIYISCGLVKCVK